MYFEAGLFSTAVVIVARECSEAGCCVALSESLATLTASGIGTDGTFWEGSNLGRFGGILHRGISMGVVG